MLIDILSFDGYIVYIMGTLGLLRCDMRVLLSNLLR